MSKKYTILCNLALMSTLTLVGCSENKSVKAAKPIASAQLASSLVESGKTQEGAEMFARVGEILLSKPEGIVYANAMFEKALEANPNNGKANVYSALLAPYMKAKGFIPRFKMALPDQKFRDALIDLEKKVKNGEVKEFIDFALVMPEGVKAGSKADDIRKFIRDEYAGEIKNSLAKLERVTEGVVLEIDRSSYIQSEIKYDVCSFGSSTVNTVTGEIALGEIDQCVEVISHREVKKSVKLDAYDLKALKVILKTQRTALMIASSIGLDGAEAVKKKVEKGSIKTDKDAVLALEAAPRLLKIEGSKADIKEIFDHSEDVMNDLIDFSKIQNEICKSSDRNSNLLSSICVSEETAATVEQLLMLVVGPTPLVIGVDQDEHDVSVDVDTRALLNSNVTSLQDLLPNKFDSNGKALDVKDPTFGGVFPNGDLLSKLKTTVK